MEYGARPMRSTRRLANTLGHRPGWYAITNSAAGQPTMVSIYDEIGFFGVAAGEFMADLKGISGDIELHINSPGGDVHDGLAIFNQLKQRPGVIAVVVDGLAASAASFIAQAASPGRLQMAPHSQMMVHNGFSMAIGDAADLRKTADLLDMITGEIAAIYAERSGKPADFWLGQMKAETWYTDQGAVDAGLADSILGREKVPAAGWDLSVYARAPGAAVVNADGAGKDLGDGWVEDADGTVRFDPDGDGDDDSTPEGDTDHDYWAADGSQLKDIPARPGAANAALPHGDGQGDGGDGGGKKKKKKPPFPGAAPPFEKKPAGRAGMFPVLAADVDNSPWDAGKAWKAGAASDDPAAFYKGICAGRKAGDPSTQGAWALPYKYSPSSPPNAAGVKAALSRLPQTQGLTNADEAKALLQRLMKQINPDYDPDALADPAVLAAVLPVPAAAVDDSPWDAAQVLRAALASADPAWYFRAVCAGRRPATDPAAADGWALPWRRTPDGPPNATAVRAALAALPYTRDIVNPAQARATLETAMKTVDPAQSPDDTIDPALLGAAFALGLEGAT